MRPGGYGFSMKSTAPLRIACTASGTSACPVTITTGIGAPGRADKSLLQRQPVHARHADIHDRASTRHRCAEPYQRLEHRLGRDMLLYRISGRPQQQRKRATDGVIVIDDVDKIVSDIQIHCALHGR